MAKQPTIKDVLTAVQDLAARSATKDDLRGFATKEDLRGFATKEDLRGFATKDDLRGFATKEDLQILASHIDETFATKENLEGMGRDIVSEIDRFVTLHQRLDVEYVSLRSRCDRIEDRLERNQIR